MNVFHEKYSSKKSIYHPELTSDALHIYNDYVSAQATNVINAPKEVMKPVQSRFAAGVCLYSLLVTYLGLKSTIRAAERSSSTSSFSISALNTCSRCLPRKCTGDSAVKRSTRNYALKYVI